MEVFTQLSQPFSAEGCFRVNFFLLEVCYINYLGFRVYIRVKLCFKAWLTDRMSSFEQINNYCIFAKLNIYKMICHSDLFTLILITLTLSVRGPTL